MTRKRKPDERVPSDPSPLVGTIPRQRRSSESLNHSRESNTSNTPMSPNNVTKERKDETVPDSNTNNNSNNDNNKETKASSVIPKVEHLSPTSSNQTPKTAMHGMGKNMKHMAIHSLTMEDKPIRKSHRISKLRKAKVNSKLPSTAQTSLSSPPSGSGTQAKNPPQSHPSSSSAITSTSGANLNSQCHGQQSSSQAQDKDKEAPGQGTAMAPPKPIRKILVWRENDTRWFFEALCEHGKDFHHIQSYIASKYERKGIAADLIKNYENVRHYYYRMWHKVSQMLKIPYEIEKNVLETYGLINYGELWKRVGSKLDGKLMGNLQQLVIYGFTVFRVKGKMFRVRTPVCNALKRIHNIEVPKPKTYQIPKEITVEIIPETNRDWIHVQKLSQNPRLRTKLTLQHRLSSLIEHLERRWNKEAVLEKAMQHLFSDPGEDLPKIEQSFFIRLKPKNVDKIFSSIYLKATGNSVGKLRSCRNPVPAQSSNLDLSLSSLLNKQKLKKDDKDKGNKTPNKDAKDGKSKDKTDEDKKEDNDESDKTRYKATKSGSETVNQKDEPEMPQFRMFQMLDELNEKCSDDVIEDEDVIIEEGRLFDLEPNDLFEAVSLLEPPENMTLVQWLDCDQDDMPVEVPDEEEKEEEKEGSGSISNVKNLPEIPGKAPGRKRTLSASLPNVELLNIEQAKKGWTKAEADSLSIGELYLLLGSPEKVQFQYSWNEKKNEAKICDDFDDSMDADEEIFDRLAFCANALLASFKKPTLEDKGSVTDSAKKNVKAKKRKAPKKLTTKVSKATETDMTLVANSSEEVITEKVKVIVKTPKKSQIIPQPKPSSSVKSTTIDRLPTSCVKVPPVPEDKVKEALADLYSNSQSLFRRSKMKSPVKPATPSKEKPYEFVVSIGPSFVKNQGQGTFQVQPNEASTSSASPKSIIPIKFIPNPNPVTQSSPLPQPQSQPQAHQQSDHSHQPSHPQPYQPFSRHHMFPSSNTAHPIQHQSSSSLSTSATTISIDQQFTHQSSVANEFGSNFLQQPTSGASSGIVHRQTSSSTWLNEYHNDSSMSSLLAACDLLSQENACHKPRDITLTDNSVDLISQFADIATQQHNLQS